MPEGLEAELYARAARGCVGRRIAAVVVDERQSESVAIVATCTGATVEGVSRHGKQVMLDLDGDRVLGLHFGMTGRLVVDGESVIDRLEYSSRRDDAAWDRLRVTFDDGGVLRVNDPRRWATFSVRADTDGLGPDFLSVTAAELVRAFGSRRAVKAVLLDQHAVAGFGNMLVDELLWHTRVAPARPARSLTGAEVRRLAAVSGDLMPAMLSRGGSHTGVLSPNVRATAGPCPRPRCNGSLQRTTVATRTTVWCPLHQR